MRQRRLVQRRRTVRSLDGVQIYLFALIGRERVKGRESLVGEGRTKDGLYAEPAGLALPTTRLLLQMLNRLI